MNGGITLISLLDENSIIKIKDLISKTGEKICKVPFRKNISDRYEVDRLPIHFTVSAWKSDMKEIVLKGLEKITFPKTKIIIDGVDIMNGKENSYVLYFSIKENKDLKKLLSDIYNIIPNEKYNPNSFIFHITIHIDQDYEKIIRMKKIIEDNFKNFEVSVNGFGLFEVYSARLIYTPKRVIN